MSLPCDKYTPFEIHSIVVVFNSLIVSISLSAAPTLTRTQGLRRYQLFTSLL